MINLKVYFLNTVSIKELRFNAFSSPKILTEVQAFKFKCSLRKPQLTQSLEDLLGLQVPQSVALLGRV